MKRRSWFALVLLLGSTSSLCAQLTPEEALKKFSVAEGLQIELFAAEPLFVNPTCIDVDHKGRVWVCESVNYRTHLRKQPLNRAEGDRLVVLEDGDGDGKADKATTFYQDPQFLAPLGVAVSPYPDGKGQKIYVCHSPHIYVFEDRNDDLKADGPPQILLTGFKGYDHDHGVHGVHFGPDGKLYFSVGDQGVDGLKDKHGKVWKSNSTDCRAGTIWRCDADGTNLELLAHNFRNEYEPAVDSFGTVFVSDNDDDGNQQTRICYVMYGGNYGYHPRGKGESHWHEEQPGVVHKVLRTYFGSPTGLCWYEGGLVPWTGGRKPGDFYGRLWHTEAGPRHVRCYYVKAKGAGYEIDREDVVSSTDNWFRPSDVCVAPDGSIFVSDWYDPGVGGHGMGDKTRGRIYRLTPKGHSGYKIPAVDTSSAEKLAPALSSPNLSVRQGAFLAVQRMAVETGEDARKFEDAFRKLHDAKNDLFLRARSLYLHASKTHLASGYWLGDLLLDPDERIRLLVIRVFKDRFGKAPHEYVSHGKGLHWENVLKDASPAVRREALLALRDVSPSEMGVGQSRVGTKLLELAKQFDGQDHFYLAAVGIAVGTDPKRREIILAEFEKHFPDWNEKVAKLVWELRPPQAMKLVESRLTDPKVPVEQKVQMLDVVAAAEGTAGGVTLLKLVANVAPAELREAALKNLKTHLPARWSALKNSPELKAAIDNLLSDKATSVQGIELIAAADQVDGVRGLTLIRLAQDQEQPEAVRVAALRALSASVGSEAADKVLLLVEVPVLRKEALESLGRMPNNKQAWFHLENLLHDMKRPLDLREQVVSALALSRQGTIILLDAHAAGKLPEALLPETGRILRNSPYPDLRNKALIAFPAPGKIDPKKLPPIAKLLTRKGDIGQGKQVFTVNKDLGCIRCHSVRGVGGSIGPDLSMIGKKASRENLFESLLFPDKAIADQYIRWIVETKQGVFLDGLLVEETPEHILLRDANGKDHKILKTQIEERKKSPNSLMPGDLLAHMTEQELVDLVDYLAELKTPALGVESWHIVGPFDNLQNDAGLDKVYPPEQQIDLAASYDGKKGKVQWKTVKPNGEGYVDLQAFFGASSSSEIVSYLYREIDSPADQEATVLIGTDDGAKLFVNGEVVLSHRLHLAAKPEQDKVKLKLKKGKNTVLLKINNGDGPHGFYFTIVSEQELKLK